MNFVEGAVSHSGKHGNVNWKKIATIIAVIAGSIGLLKIADGAFWNLEARERTINEIHSATDPINQRLDKHELIFVTKDQFEEQLKDASRDREEIKKSMDDIGKQVGFIYREAYRNRYGAPPPNGNGNGNGTNHESSTGSHK